MDNLYYQGPFWIVADNFKDILRGNFKLLGKQYECDRSGTYTDDSLSKRQRTHKKIWIQEYQDKYHNADWDYFPRGRVSIYEGTAFIHLNSRCNLPKVIDAVISKYHLAELEVEIDLNDTYQGDHYNFQLK